MRILTVGGTKFVGRHLVQAALSAGHEVTLLHRGRSNPGLFPDAEHLIADRDEPLKVLAERHFDATVDVSAYVPRQVRALAEALDGGGGHHVYISTVSVYAPPDAPGYDESSPLTDPPADPRTERVDPSTYGGLKVLCEQAAREAYGNLTVVRPTYVVGPHDHTGRFTWWVRRIARGGQVLAPGPAAAPVQVVDARDLAAWTLGLLEERLGGTFHAAHPAPPYGFGDLLEDIAAAVAPAGTTLRWVEQERLLAAGLDGRTLPLWAGEESPQERLVGAANSAAAQATGLRFRPVSDSARDTLDDTETPVPEGVGLDPRRESQLLQ
ncbi:MAG TPA: NAD-dependent epimerase/dehydratase family protein [Mycobacteriales bacterium]|jgi:2'-hydroxyisoflavone reductase|nr:NAD-dependent epimerase/dehydratase family protein [Mycobacteriales bacterium]